MLFNKILHKVNREAAYFLIRLIFGRSRSVNSGLRNIPLDELANTDYGIYRGELLDGLRNKDIASQIKCRMTCKVGTHFY